MEGPGHQLGVAQNVFEEIILFKIKVFEILEDLLLEIWASVGNLYLVVFEFLRNFVPCIQKDSPKLLDFMAQGNVVLFEDVSQLDLS